MQEFAIVETKKLGKAEVTTSFATLEDYIYVREYYSTIDKKVEDADQEKYTDVITIIGNIFCDKCQGVASVGTYKSIRTVLGIYRSILHENVYRKDGNGFAGEFYISHPRGIDVQRLKTVLSYFTPVGVCFVFEEECM